MQDRLLARRWPRSPQSGPAQSGNPPHRSERGSCLSGPDGYRLCWASPGMNDSRDVAKGILRSSQDHFIGLMANWPPSALSIPRPPD